MEMAFLAVGGLFSLTGLICHILVLIHAFQNSTGEGFLCLCIPCYAFYYMFAKFEHPYKTPIIVGALAGNIIGGTLTGMARSR